MTGKIEILDSEVGSVQILEKGAGGDCDISDTNVWMCGGVAKWKEVETNGWWGHNYLKTGWVKGWWDA